MRRRTVCRQLVYRMGKKAKKKKLQRKKKVYFDNLRLLFNYIQLANLHSTDKSMLCSAVTLAFFGMLRSAEYTSPTSSNFFIGSTLQPSDISFSESFQFASVRIKKSKTDPFKCGCTIRIAATNSPFCPVNALVSYLRARSNVDGPLYRFHNGQFLTRHFISNLLSLALPHVPNINTHSFRIGGASAAASAGIQDSVIQIMGRWSSDAYKRYIRLSDHTVRDVGMRISSISHNSKFWDTDTGSSYPM